MIGWVVKIREVQPRDGVGKRREWLRDRVAHLIVPKRKVIDLHTADAYENAQNFQAGGLEGQDRIEARSALLNICEVNTRDVGDRLNAVDKALTS